MRLARANNNPEPTESEPERNPYRCGPLWGEFLCATGSLSIGTQDNHASMARSITVGVDAQIKVIKAEREAYNIDSGDRNTVTDTLSDLMDDLAKGQA